METQMEAFGYTSNAPDAEHLLQLREVTLLLTMAEVDVVIAFLQSVRMRFEGCSPTSGESHLHLRDWWKAWSESHPDLVVAYCGDPAGRGIARFPDKAKSEDPH